LVFTPILLTLLCLICWWRWNGGSLHQLRLRKEGVGEAVRVGAVAGAALALFNLFVILKLTIWLGYSYDFLQLTPHADLPFWLMFPFGILIIAFIIEVLFRGWMLGRLWVLMENIRGGAALSIFLSALFFSFDPFMVIYFKGYHWLALSDGLVWGGLLFKTRNLASTIAAHTVEVWIIYFILKTFYA
jgi:membrane protease YdiL (CAAX protease family)